MFVLFSHVFLATTLTHWTLTVFYLAILVYFVKEVTSNRFLKGEPFCQWSVESICSFFLVIGCLGRSSFFFVDVFYVGGVLEIPLIIIRLWEFWSSIFLFNCYLSLLNIWIQFRLSFINDTFPNLVRLVLIFILLVVLVCLALTVLLIYHYILLANLFLVLPILYLLASLCCIFTIISTYAKERTFILIDTVRKVIYSLAFLCNFLFTARFTLTILDSQFNIFSPNPGLLANATQEEVYIAGMIGVFGWSDIIYYFFGELVPLAIIAYFLANEISSKRNSQYLLNENNSVLVVNDNGYVS